MIQDIRPHILHNQYDVSASPSPDDYVIHSSGGEVLVKMIPAEGGADTNGKPSLPRVRDYSSSMKFTYLFRIDDKEFYMPEAARDGSFDLGDICDAEEAPDEEEIRDAGEAPEEAIHEAKEVLDEDAIRNTDRIHEDEDVLEADKNHDEAGRATFEFVGLRVLKSLGLESKAHHYAAITGKHITDWYRDNRFCGRCGQEMVHSETERAMTCPQCGYTCYPRIMPAVIVACIKNGRILTTHYSKGYRHYALIAGFTEIGETLEETVAREVMEETGIKVKNIRYYKSQPWGIANDILIGYICEADGDDEIVIDKNELSDAAWLAPDDLDIVYDDYSLTNELLWKFKNGEL